MFKGKYLWLAVGLFLVWGGAILLFHVAGFLLHAVLIIAIIFLIAHFVEKRISV